MINLRKHIGYYLSLFLIFSAGLILISYVSPQKNLQLIIAIITTAIYVFWGILHHFLNHELVPKIMVEYILIGSIGIGIIFFLLKGGFGI